MKQAAYDPCVARRYTLLSMRHRRIGGGALLLALVMFAVLCAAQGQLARASVKVEAGAFGTFGGGAGQFSTSTDLAINNSGAGGVSAGDLYLSDSGLARIQQFSSSGTSGSFVRAWGWDAVASGQHNTGANEQQTLTVKATAGSFTLSVTTGSSGRGTLTPGSNVITNFESTLGAFRVGDLLTSGGFASNPTITAVGPGTLTVSAPSNVSSASNRNNLVVRETTAAIPFSASATAVQEALEALPAFDPGEVTVTGGPGDATGTTPYVVTFSSGLLAHNDLAPIIGASGAPPLSGGSGTGANTVRVNTIVDGGGFEICAAGSSPADICKPGTASLAPGAIGASPQGVAVDPTNGNVFVADQANRRIGVYGATGAFQGAFGFDVIPGGASGTGTVTSGATQITAVTTASKAFLVGQSITGIGIPQGTTITTVGSGTITMSNAATAAAAGAGTPISSAASAENVPLNEQQLVTVNATAGTFKLKFETANPSASNQTTATDIPFDATAEEVQTALEALSNVGSGNVAVSGSPGGPYTVEFQGTRFADTNVIQMSVVAGTPPLSGGAGTVTVTTPREGTGVEFCTSLSGCQPGAAGGAGGQFASNSMRRLAVDPSSGHVLVPSPANARVDEFAPVVNGSDEVTGATFVRSFGWDVVASGPGTRTFDQSEQQSVSLFGAFDLGCFCILPVNGGTFTLTFNGQTTGPISYDASAAVVDQRLEDDLPNIGAGDVSVSGGPGPNSAWSIDFTGALANADVPQITGDASGLTPSGSAVNTSTTVPGGNFPAFEVCVGGVDICKAGVAEKGGAGMFNSPVDIDVDGGGHIFVVDEPGSCESKNPCRVQKFDSATLTPSDFSPSNLTFTGGAEKASRIVVEQSTGHLFVIKKTASAGVRLYEFEASGTPTADISPPPTGNGLPSTEAITVRNADRVYALEPLESRIGILAPTPPPLVSMDDPPATDITDTSATLHGEVTIPAPGGPGYETSYWFEYFVSGDKWVPVPVPALKLASNAAGTYQVNYKVVGLKPCTDYPVRIAGSTSSIARSTPAEFSTGCTAPTVESIFAEDVTQSSAALSARVSPNGLPTSYHFEWGTEPGVYPNRAPGFDRSIGGGNAVLLAQEGISGLDPASTYYFRLVASNVKEGVKTTTVAESKFETLNDCGLVGDRCYELVSPADKGPVGSAGSVAGLGADMAFQAATQGSGLAYTMEAGLPDATSGIEVLYRAFRSDNGWDSTQLSPPDLSSSEVRNGYGAAGRIRALADDLHCGVVVSAARLAPDAPLGVIEGGGGNLFRWEANGNTYATITTLNPTNLDEAQPEPLSQTEYEVVGMSQDCDRIVFRSPYRYPGIPGVGLRRLYEWNEGQLSNVGLIEGPSGAVVAETVPGAGNNFEPSKQNTINGWRAVSLDGSRTVFTAPSPEPGAENGKSALYLRIDGAPAIPVSRSETATVNNGASRYQVASNDGSRVLFTARYGLTATGSSSSLTSCASNLNGGDGTGCDLYEFDLSKPAGDRLTNLSVDSNPEDTKGASVGGVVAAADDLSYVYFAARGQLVADQGRSQAQNESANSYNLYRAHAGSLRYIGMLHGASVNGGLFNPDREATIGTESSWTTRVTPDGKTLLFVSRLNLTSYDSDEVKMTYLYSEDEGTTICLSCPADDQSPAAVDSDFRPLVKHTADSNLIHPVVMVTPDGSRAFFYSYDALAAGAGQGLKNLYEWQRGQITLLATEPADVSRNRGVAFAGVSGDGMDAYFTTSEQMNSEDTDGRSDVYDARVGGGLPPQPPPPLPCEPLSEGSCQAPGVAPSPNPSPPSSSTFNGPGNTTSTDEPKKKKKPKKKGKHKKKAGKHKQRDKKRSGNESGRNANIDRRAGK